MTLSRPGRVQYYSIEFNIDTNPGLLSQSTGRLPMLARETEGYMREVTPSEAIRGMESQRDGRTVAMDGGWREKVKK